MSLICPACNKPHQSSPVCQRCGCDLSALHAVRRAAAAWLAEARHCLLQQEWPSALEAAERSWELSHSPEAAQCAFLVGGALGDTAAVVRWHQRVSGGGRPGASDRTFE